MHCASCILHRVAVRRAHLIRTHKLSRIRPHQFVERRLKRKPQAGLTSPRMTNLCTKSHLNFYYLNNIPDLPPFSFNWRQPGGCRAICCSSGLRVPAELLQGQVWVGKHHVPSQFCQLLLASTAAEHNRGQSNANKKHRDLALGKGESRASCKRLMLSM